MAEPGEGAGACRCPYCDVETEARDEAIFCVPCKTVLVACASCGEPVREGVEKCPHCGGPTKE